MTDPSAAAVATTGVPPRPALWRIALFDIGLPLGTIWLLLHDGSAPLPAYAAASLFPAASVAVSWLGRRSLDLIGIGVLVGIASSLLLAVLTNDPRFGLVRAAPAFALFGAACLVALPTPRPLMFFVARAFATGGEPERVASWNARLAAPAFRRVMRRLTAVWGVGTLAHAVLGVSAAFLLPASTALVVEPVMGLAILAALLAWTRAVQRRAAAPRR